VAYSAYKKEQAAKNAKSFFDDQSAHDFLRERYDPRHELCRLRTDAEARAAMFHQNFNAFRNLHDKASPLFPYLGGECKVHAVRVSDLPLKHSRVSVLKALEGHKGLVHLFLGPATSDTEWRREGFAIFHDKNDAGDAVRALQQEGLEGTVGSLPTGVYMSMCLYVCLCVCVFVCVCIFMCVCVYVCIGRHRESERKGNIWATIVNPFPLPPSQRWNGRTVRTA
jgi:hypothetical protein